MGADSKIPGTGTPPEAEELSGVPALTSSIVHTFVGLDRIQPSLDPEETLSVRVVRRRRGELMELIELFQTSDDRRILHVNTPEIGDFTTVEGPKERKVYHFPRAEGSTRGEGEAALASVRVALQEHRLRTLPHFKIPEPPKAVEPAKPKIISKEQLQFAQGLIERSEGDGLVDGQPRKDMFGRTWRLKISEIKKGEGKIVKLLSGETDETYSIEGSPITPMAVFSVDSDGHMTLRDVVEEDEYNPAVEPTWESIAEGITQILDDLGDFSGEPTSSGR